MQAALFMRGSESMMKSRWKIKVLLKAVSFVLGFLCLAYLLNGALLIKRSDGITPMIDFYEQPAGTVDALLLGSSHAGMNVAVDAMWNSNGISAYALWGSVQPFWNSYYFLKEALTTQKPKVILLEVYAATFSDEFSDDARQATNTIGIKNLKNRWDAIQVSAQSERQTELFLGYPLYHDRLFELVPSDFTYYFWQRDAFDKHGGASFSQKTLEVELPKPVEEKMPLPEKEEVYLQKIIDLCKEENLQLVFFLTPTPDAAYWVPLCNSIDDIAQRNGIPFINFNYMYDQLEIDSNACWMEDGNHLRYQDATKIGNYLAQYLADHYQLTDHRGDDRYESWNVYSREIQRQAVQNSQDVETYLSYVEKAKDILYITYDGSLEGCPLWEASVADLLPEKCEITQGNRWCAAIDFRNGETFFWLANEDESTTKVNLWGRKIEFDTAAGTMVCDFQNMSKSMPGLNLVAYNTDQNRIYSSVSLGNTKNGQIKL